LRCFAAAGHSGYTIDHGGPGNRDGLSSDIDLVNVIKAQKPHIVTLMIGTNDIDSDVPDIPPRLGRLMDSMLNADSLLLLVVAQIVPQQKATPDTRNMQIQVYNAAVADLVKARADAGKQLAQFATVNSRRARRGSLNSRAFASLVSNHFELFRARQTLRGVDRYRKPTSPVPSSRLHAGGSAAERYGLQRIRFPAIPLAPTETAHVWV